MIKITNIKIKFKLKSSVNEILNFFNKKKAVRNKPKIPNELNINIIPLSKHKYGKNKNPTTVIK